MAYPVPNLVSTVRSSSIFSWLSGFIAQSLQWSIHVGLFQFTDITIVVAFAIPLIYMESAC
jgi:hypothetical protein